MRRPTRIVARDIGAEAAIALRDGGAGVVAAVFERSIYVRFGARWICLGNADIGSGPVNVPCRASLDWRSLTVSGARAVVDGSSLELGQRCRIGFAGAPGWMPAPCPVPDWPRVSDALDVLCRALPSERPADGFAGLIGADGAARGLVTRAAEPAIRQLRRWITGEAAEPGRELAGAVQRLVGLGPGLTPSGDDFLGGALAALRHAGRADLADSLWAAIGSLGGDATSAISYCHLEAAARGQLGEDLHRVLVAVLSGEGDAVRRAVRPLRDKANNSPWDGLCGIEASLRALDRLNVRMPAFAATSPFSQRAVM